MPKLKPLIAMLLLSTLTACATQGTPATVANSRSDACLWLAPLKYSTPELDADGNPKPVENDVGNQLDTPQTILDITGHNRAFLAICPTP